MKTITKTITCENCSKKFNPRGIATHRKYCVAPVEIVAAPHPFVKIILKLQDEIFALEDQLVAKRNILAYLQAEVVE